MDPLVTNYIFAHVRDKERLQVLRRIGIVRCVSFGGELVPVREEELSPDAG